MVLLEFPELCLALAFILGAVVGSFLNVCILRLPLEKSIVWPSSHCFNCFQPIRGLDNVPLLSYWRLRGKCRTCGATFSSRYFWIELLTACTWAGLFWFEVVQNGRHVPVPDADGVPAASLVAIWFYHSVFFSLLIVVTFTDIDHKEIPLGVTVFGTIVGIVGATLCPWPWPLESGEVFSNPSIQPRDFALPVGVQFWPVWWPTFGWPKPGTWEMGLVSSLAGALVGTGMIRLIRLVFGWAFDKEAMGLGDADLLMMIGAFLGWQSFFIVLIFAVFLGLVYALYLFLRNKGSELPFGPFLSGGAVLTVILSPWLANFQPFFFDLGTVMTLAVLAAIVSLFMSVAIRMMRLVGQAA